MEQSEIQNSLSTLEEEFEGESDRQTIFDILGIETRETKFTRFLRWMLDPEETHDKDTVFLDDFLTLFDISGFHPITVDEFCQFSREDEDAEIDIVIEGEDLVLGVEIKTSHQEHQEKLDKEEKALEEAYAGKERELLLLTIPTAESGELDEKTRYWDELVDKFEGHLPSDPGYEEGLIRDFVYTVRRNIMTDFDGLSESAEQYVKHQEAIDEVRESFLEEREQAASALARRFKSAVEQDNWEITNSESTNYVKIYQPQWHDNDLGVDIEYEPHFHFKAGSAGTSDAPDGPCIVVRLDVESGSGDKLGRKEARKKLRDAISEEDWVELRDHGLTTKDASTYRFISTTVDFPATAEDQDPLQAAMEKLEILHQHVFDAVEEVVQKEAD